VNTYDTEDDRDVFESPHALRAWLLENELIDADARVDRADVAYAVETREALRRMLLANGGGPSDEQAVETVNRGASRANLTLRFDADGSSHLTPLAGGVDGAIGTILSVAFASMAAGSWTRLKVCPEETCRVAFFDHSKNRSRRWCSMEVCGNRTKVRAFRARHLDA
jgi:predicted RNA-binding Zn ribbon-like protein